MAREVSILSFVCFTLIGKIPDIEPFVCCFGHALLNAFATHVDGHTIKYSSLDCSEVLHGLSWELGEGPSLFVLCSGSPSLEHNTS